MDKLHTMYKGKMVARTCSVLGCHGVAEYIMVKPEYHKGGVVCKDHRFANPQFSYMRLN